MFKLIVMLDLNDKVNTDDLPADQVKVASLALSDDTDRTEDELREVVIKLANMLVEHHAT